MFKFSKSKIMSMLFLLLSLIITLALGSFEFLINDNPESLREIGMNDKLEGMNGPDDYIKDAKKNMKQMEKDLQGYRTP